MPSAFVPLPALPRTPSGKLDRAALPDPASEAARPAQAGAAAPRTAVEQVLAEIWADLLGRERVGIHDDFFRAGRPLPARRPARGAGAAGAWGRAVAAHRLRDADRGRARRPGGRGLGRAGGAAGRAGFPGRGRSLFPSPSNGSGSSTGWRPAIPPTTASPRPVSPAAWTSAPSSPPLREIVRVQESLRTTFPAVEGRPVQRPLPGFAPDLPVADLTGLPEERRLPEALRLASRRPAGRSTSPPGLSCA